MVHMKRGNIVRPTGGCTNGAEKLQAHQRLEAERKQRMFLASEAGQKHLAEIEERKKMDEVRRIKEAEERRVAEFVAIEEEKYRKTWIEKIEALREIPKAGTVIESELLYWLRVETNPNKPSEISVYALLRVNERAYPEEPKRVLAGSHGRWGLRIFLNKQSRQRLEAQYPNSFRMARESMDLIQMDKPIRIIGATASGKACHGEIVWSATTAVETPNS